MEEQLAFDLETPERTHWHQCSETIWARAFWYKTDTYSMMINADTSIGHRYTVIYVHSNLTCEAKIYLSGKTGNLTITKSFSDLNEAKRWADEQYKKTCFADYVDTKERYKIPCIL